MSDPLGGLGEAPPAPEPPARQPRPFTPTTWALCAVLAIAFVVEAVVGHDLAVESESALFRLGALFAPAVADGDFWRLGAYSFLHIGWIHLFVNGWSLWVITPQLELTFGSNAALGLYSASALAGGLASTAWALHSGHAALGAGASGGVFGLFGATIALFLRIRSRLDPAARSRFMRGVLVTIVINAAIAVKAPVDNFAHLGGAAAGLLLGLVAELRGLEPRFYHRPVSVLLIGCALVLFANEGVAMAWAARPKPRALRGNGAEARVPGLFMPDGAGRAVIPGEAAVEISRENAPLALDPGADAVRLGDRTFVREHEQAQDERFTLATADGTGHLVVDFHCAPAACARLDAGRLSEQIAASLHARP